MTAAHHTSKIRLLISVLVALMLVVVTFPWVSSQPTHAVTNVGNDGWPASPTNSSTTGSDPCADVLFVGVRGSGETSAYGDKVEAVRDGLRDGYGKVSGVGEQRSVREVYVDYTSAPVQVLFDDLARNLDNLKAGVDKSKWVWNYIDSIDNGVSVLRRVLSDSTMRCPHEKWVLAGYSQGALVINHVLEEFDDYSRYGAVVLIANPARYPEQLVNNTGGTAPTTTGQGAAAYLWKLPIPKSLNGLVYSICDYLDSVCDTSSLLDSAIANQTDPTVAFERGNSIHGSYDPDTLKLFGAAGPISQLLGMPVPVQDSFSQQATPHVDFFGKVSAKSVRPGVTLSWQVKPGTSTPAGPSPSSSFLIAADGTYGGNLPMGSYYVQLQARGEFEDHWRNVPLWLTVASPYDEPAVIGTHRVGWYPQGLAVQPDGSRYYVTNPYTRTLSVYDAATSSEVSSIGTGYGPWALAINPAGTYIYMAHRSDNTVWAINTATNNVAAIIPVGATPTALVFDTTGERLYVANYGHGTISVINTGTNEVTSTISTGWATLPTALAIAPDGKFLYAAGYNSGLMAIDVTTNTLVRTVGLNGNSTSIAVNPAGTKIYVASERTTFSQDTVSVFDAKSLAAEAKIFVGSQPRSVSIDPQGSAIYVAGGEPTKSGEMRMINPLTNVVTATVPIGSNPQVSAMNSAGTRLYVTNQNGLSVSEVRLLPSFPPLVPDAPSVIAGDGQAHVNVAAASGGTPATFLTVTAHPGGRQCAVNNTAGSCNISGLSNGTAYTFTVTATNSSGTSPASQPSTAVTPSKVLIDVQQTTAFHDEIYWLFGAGISTGWAETDGTTTYRPLQPVNRDAMAAFMYRLSGSPAFTPPSVSPFSDIATTSQFYKEIAWLANEGISTGWIDANGTRTYRPLQPVHRDAMAAFMYRLAGSRLAENPNFVPPSVSPFADVTPRDQFYKEITWLASTGISTGWTEPNGTKTFRSVQSVNRDAMAAFMYRYDLKLGSIGGALWQRTGR